MYLDFCGAVRVISRTKLSGFGEHWGVQLPDTSVIHLTPERGIHISPFAKFAMGQQVKTVRVVSTDKRFALMQRINVALANTAPYHPTQWNCEVFANWLTGEEPTSAQVVGWFFLAAVGGVFWAMTAR